MKHISDSGVKKFLFKDSWNNLEIWLVIVLAYLHLSFIVFLVALLAGQIIIYMFHRLLDNHPSFTIEYSLTGGYDAHTLEICEELANDIRSLMVESCKVESPYLAPIIWTLTRFRRRKMELDKITYTFPLLPVD